jgi:hypothetical protein
MISTRNRHQLLVIHRSYTQRKTARITQQREQNTQKRDVFALMRQGVDFKIKMLDADGKRINLTIWDTGPAATLTAFLFFSPALFLSRISHANTPQAHRHSWTGEVPLTHKLVLPWHAWHCAW